MSYFGHGRTALVSLLKAYLPPGVPQDTAYRNEQSLNSEGLEMKQGLILRTRLEGRLDLEPRSGIALLTMGLEKEGVTNVRANDLLKLTNTETQTDALKSLAKKPRK